MYLFSFLKRVLTFFLLFGVVLLACIVIAFQRGVRYHEFNKRIK
jgi:cbb3-type cytochrome oxidase subunit 3